MNYSKCIVCYHAVGWIGLGANFAISILKIVVGVISGSHALAVDALYSGKDVLTSFLIILGLKFTKQPIDEEHQFGHGKAEFLFSMIIGLSLIIITALVLYFEAGKLIQGTHHAPHLIALWTAIFAAGANVMLARYTRCVAFQINSPMVGVLTQHQKSDATASLAVALGIIGSHYLNMPWLDTVVAVGECIDLGYMGGEVFIHAVRGLMDIAAPEKVVTKIQKLSSLISGVKKVEIVRTRRVGQEIWVSLVIGVDPELSIHEAKKISLVVRKNLFESIPHLGEVNVHFKSVKGSVPELDYILRQSRSHLELEIS
ncbi:Magnetosome protein MamM [Gammaproteobacteria bacterium]